MLDSKDTGTLLRQVFAESFGIEPDSLKNNTRLEEDLELDSLDRIQLVSEVENCFQIEAPEDQIKGIYTFGELVCRIDQLLNSKTR